MSDRGRIAPRRPASRASGSGRGRGESGGATPRGLLPILLVVVLAFGASAAWRWWGPGASPTATAVPGVTPGGGRPLPARPKAPAMDGAPVRIEVVNGSGEPGAAAKLASYLRDGGFNVVLVGSGDRYDYVRTIVVDRTGNERAAAAVAAYLGPVQRVRQRARSEADVTVVVGRDRGRVPWGEGRTAKGRG